MNTALTIILSLAAILLLVSYVASRPRGEQLTPLANVGEGFIPSVKTYLADAVVATRYLIAKPGTDENHVGICGVNDIPKGIFTDEAEAAEDSVAVALFGMHKDGALGIASAAIAVDAFVVPAANGKLRTLPATTGTYYIIGRCTKAAGADGDKVEFVPCFPTQRVVA